jgi:hypothetical protein
LYILVMALKSHLCCFQKLSFLFCSHVSLPCLGAVFCCCVVFY